MAIKNLPHIDTPDPNLTIMVNSSGKVMEMDLSTLILSIELNKENNMKQSPKELAVFTFKATALMLAAAFTVASGIGIALIMLGAI